MVPSNSGERCNERCTATLHMQRNTPSNYPQVVENIGALHATLQTVAVRCVAPPSIGVQRCNATGRLEHVSGVLARVVASRPDVFDRATRLRIFQAARGRVGRWHDLASDSHKSCKYFIAML